MDDYKSSVGKSLLKILMFNMYSDSKTIYREYVQNSLDSISAAVQQGILSKMKDGHIAISILQNNRTIIIEDNGKGISKDEVARTLLNIADSNKDGISTAGQFGIGRLVGAGYCKKLIFETSALHESKKSIIEIDVNLVDDILRDADIQLSANEVMDTVSSFDVQDEDPEAHYFKVILSEIKDSYSELLDENNIVEYLQEVAPIDFGLPFKNRFVTSLSEEKKKYFDLIPNVRISVNKKTDIRKRYGLKVEGTGDNIESLEVFTINDPDFGNLAWGWFAVTKFSIQIPVSDKNRGLRLRKHNIQIGDSKVLTDLFREPRGNFYFYGEVHITNNELEPDSGRSGLAPSIESDRLKALLSKYFLDLSALYTLANKAKNAVKAIADLSQKVDKPGFAEDEKDTFLNNIEAKRSEFDKIEKKADVDQCVSKVIQLYKESLEEIETPKYKRREEQESHIGEDKQPPQDSVASKEENENGSLVQDSPAGEQTPQSVDNHPSAGKEGESLEEDTPSPAPKIKDIFAPLKGVLSDKEAFVVRRVFKSLSDNCPSQNKKLIEELKVMVIKDLTRN